MKKWSPTSWLLAQDAHFAYGLAIFFGVYTFRAWPGWIIVILIAELVFKEGLFDVYVEGNPLVWNGLIDWSFYLLGSMVAAILFILMR